MHMTEGHSFSRRYNLALIWMRVKIVINEKVSPLSNVKLSIKTVNMVAEMHAGGILMGCSLFSGKPGKVIVKLIHDFEKSKTVLVKS